MKLLLSSTFLFINQNDLLTSIFVHIRQSSHGQFRSSSCFHGCAILAIFDFYYCRILFHNLLFAHFVTRRPVLLPLVRWILILEILFILLVSLFRLSGTWFVFWRSFFVCLVFGFDCHNWADIDFSSINNYEFIVQLWIVFHNMRFRPLIHIIITNIPIINFSIRKLSWIISIAILNLNIWTPFS